jgi:hypothetical protein
MLASTIKKAARLAAFFIVTDSLAITQQLAVIG